MSPKRRPVRKSPKKAKPAAPAVPAEVSSTADTPEALVEVLLPGAAEHEALAGVPGGVVSAADLGSADAPPAIRAGAVRLPELGFVLASAAPDRAEILLGAAGGEGAPPASLDRGDVPGQEEPTGPAPGLRSYICGYRDAVNKLAEELGLGAAEIRSTAAAAPADFRDDPRGTWGLHATNVLNSRYTGRGVRVAALVDGLDTAHRDWAGRPVVLRSFVTGEPPTAGTSGTHYLGTAFGTDRPAAGPRYGCAPGVELFVAKVLRANGTGDRTAILAGLDWAVANQCRVILLPLGWAAPPPDPLFEQVARRARALGALVVAGVGNNANRAGGHFGAVANPAACPSVVGTAAVDSRLGVANFSPRGAVALAAPGVNLRSSISGPAAYAVWSGTATAAAYLAGVAALWAEAHPAAGPVELLAALVAGARPLPLGAADVGAGLIQAP